MRSDIKPIAILAIDAPTLRYGATLDTNDPIFALSAPISFANCFCLPASVLASAAFISPTLSVIICANIAARSCSLPFLMAASCASVNVIPTRRSAEVIPIIALPIRLATLTASPASALKPRCCATRLFIAGISTSSDDF
ncbi:unknown [Prevotella sp. CAG:873]|nr:unknown [Prevotella sp. CAG:873]